MPAMSRLFPILLALLLPAIAGGQVLRDPEPEVAADENETPLVLRKAASEPPTAEESLHIAIAKLRQRLRAIVESTLSEAEKQEQIDQLVAEHPLIFPMAAAEPGTRYGRTPAEIEAHLEQMLFEEAAELAPDEESRQQIQQRAKAIEDPEPDVLYPVLVRPGQRRVPAGPEPGSELETVTTDSERIVLDAPESPEKEATEVKVEVLADQEVTESMHDDTTVLRTVTDDEGGQLLFGRMHFWAGGAIQYDLHRTEGVLGLQDGGSSETDTGFRRAEVIVRAGIFEDGEVKAQYDIDGDIWRDLYWRWVSEEMNTIITVGNQKEPIGLDYLEGNKFGTAMERSAPATAFGSFRGGGVRLNRWWRLKGHHRLMEFGEAKQSIITATGGLFTEGMDSNKDTDLALTGRLTYGWLRSDEAGFHVGASATLREGEFDSIEPRPESQNSSRVNLAEFEADNQYMLGLETLFTRGSLYGQGEIYLSDYRGGETDAQGWGGYVQAGWMLTGENRTYRPRWGLWGPVKPLKEHAFEIFGRFSYTYGDSDEQSSNDLRMVTLGGSWYHRQWRGTVNLLYGATDRDVQEEDSGYAVTTRIQYIF